VDNFEQTRYISCVLCEASCGLEVKMRGPEILSIRGHDADPLSRGHICPKAVALQDLHSDPDRLRTPVRRVGERWEPIGWDEANDLVASRLHEVQAAHGPNALAAYLGNPNVHSLGYLTHGVSFVRALGTRSVYSATSVDQLPHQLVSWALYGHQFLIPIPDIDRTSLFVVFGGNPMASNGSIMTTPDFPGRLRELRARGGRMIVFDPRRTETAKVADEHHFVRPGTDVLVLLAIINVLFADGLTRPAPYVDNVQAVRDAVAGFTPEAVQDVCRVPADVIRGLARQIGTADGAAVYGRMGVSTQAFGTLCQWAIHTINILTGNLDRAGGVLLTSPAIDMVGMRLLGKGHLGAWRSRVRGLPEFGGELPVSVLAEEIATPGEGQIRALVTMAGNPVSSTPGGHRLDEALAGLDFMVSVDIYINETTRHADVILPPTGPLERDHYDLIFHIFAVRNTARFSRALYEQPAQARHDWEIYRDLALALDARRGDDPARRPVDEERLRTSPDKIIDSLLSMSSEPDLSVSKLLENPGGVDLGPLRPQLPDRLATQSQRIDLAPSIITEGLPEVRGLLAGTVSGEHDLLLIGRRHQRDNNSWMHNQARLTKGKPRHQLLVHPADLQARGIASGDRVRVASASGELEVECLSCQDMMPGVVSLPHGYGHARPGVRLEAAVALPGACINDITDPGVVEGIGANAVVNGVPVSIASAG
jgi:anaerobic selenocysteine-containing dehydrogenase